MNLGMMQTEIPADLHRMAKIYAVTHGRQLREVVALAIREYLARHGEQASQQAPKKKAPKPTTKAVEEEAKALEIADSVIASSSNTPPETPYFGAGGMDRPSKDTENTDPDPYRP